MNRKGSETVVSTWVWIILALLVIIGSSIVYGNFIKKPQAIISCTGMHGTCTPGTCTLKQIAYLGDTSVGCKTGQICCIDVTTDTRDKDCVDSSTNNYKPLGTDCGTGKICDTGISNTCVSLCDDFCIKNKGSTVSDISAIVKSKCGTCPTK